MPKNNSGGIITKSRVSNIMATAAISTALYMFVSGGITEISESPNG